MNHHTDHIDHDEHVEAYTEQDFEDLGLTEDGSKALRQLPERWVPADLIELTEHMPEDERIATRVLALSVRYYWDLYAPDSEAIYDRRSGNRLSQEKFNKNLTHLAVLVPVGENRNGVMQYERVSPAALWFSNSAYRRDVHGVTVDPSQPDRSMVEVPGVGLMANAYREREFNVEPTPAQEKEARETVDMLLRNQTTSERDFQIYRNWIAAKVQHPEWRGVAIANLASEKGTGRGATFTLVREMFAPGLVVETDIGDLYGTSSGSNFDGWFHGALIVCFAETELEEQHRERAARRFKEFVAPRPTKRRVNLKNRQAFDETLLTSFMFASNNVLNPLPLEKGDRRVTMLDSRNLKIDETHNPDLYHRLERMFGSADVEDARELSEALLHGAYRYLKAVAVDKTMFMEPEHNAARERVIEAREGPVHAALARVLADVPGDCLGLFVRDVASRVFSIVRNETKKGAKTVTDEVKKALLDGDVRGWVMVGEVYFEPPEGVDEQALSKVQGVSIRANGRASVRGLLVRAHVAAGGGNKYLNAEALLAAVEQERRGGGGGPDLKRLARGLAAIKSATDED